MDAAASGDLWIIEPRKSGKAKSNKRGTKKSPPETKVTVSVDGGPEAEMGTPEAEALLKDTIRRKLANEGETPMSERANQEMFSADESGETAAQTVAAGQLRSFIERVERLEEEKQTITDDIKEVYAEMKGVGFDAKAVRTLVRLRKKDQAERQEEEAILDLYKTALGMA